MTRTEMLRAAAALIATAVESLDTSGHVCAECNATRRENWTEYQAAIALKHLPAKLHDQASRLEQRLPGWLREQLDDGINS
jgi:hypothetical protein